MAEDNPAIVTQYKIVPDYKTPKMERMEVAKHILEVSPPHQRIIFASKNFYLQVMRFTINCLGRPFSKCQVDVHDSGAPSYDRQSDVIACILAA